MPDGTGANWSKLKKSEGAEAVLWAQSLKPVIALRFRQLLFFWRRLFRVMTVGDYVLKMLICV
jgi:hypothetical protein